MNQFVHDGLIKMVPPFQVEPLLLEGQVGLEPTTFCLRGRRSNQLSYWPVLSVKCA